MCRFPSFRSGVYTHYCGFLNESARHPINHSLRHKSGIAVRFPRMLRIRSDKPLHEADDIGVLQAMLAR